MITLFSSYIPTLCPIYLTLPHFWVKYIVTINSEVTTMGGTDIIVYIDDASSSVVTPPPIFSTLMIQKRIR